MDLPILKQYLDIFKSGHSALTDRIFSLSNLFDKAVSDYVWGSQDERQSPTSDGSYYSWFSTKETHETDYTWSDYLPSGTVVTLIIPIIAATLLFAKRYKKDNPGLTSQTTVISTSNVERRERKSILDTDKSDQSPMKAEERPKQSPVSKSPGKGTNQVRYAKTPSLKTQRQSPAKKLILYGRRTSSLATTSSCSSPIRDDKSAPKRPRNRPVPSQVPQKCRLRYPIASGVAKRAPKIKTQSKPSPQPITFKTKSIKCLPKPNRKTCVLKKPVYSTLSTNVTPKGKLNQDNQRKKSSALLKQRSSSFPKRKTQSRDASKSPLKQRRSNSTKAALSSSSPGKAPKSFSSTLTRRQRLSSCGDKLKSQIGIRKRSQSEDTASPRKRKNSKTQLVAKTMMCKITQKKTANRTSPDKRKLSSNRKNKSSPVEDIDASPIKVLGGRVFRRQSRSPAKPNSKKCVSRWGGIITSDSTLPPTQQTGTKMLSRGRKFSPVKRQSRFRRKSASKETPTLKEKNSSTISGGIIVSKRPHMKRSCEMKIIDRKNEVENKPPTTGKRAVSSDNLKKAKSFERRNSNVTIGRVCKKCNKPRPSQTSNIITPTVLEALSSRQSPNSSSLFSFVPKTCVNNSRERSMGTETRVVPPRKTETPELKSLQGQGAFRVFTQAVTNTNTNKSVVSLWKDNCPTMYNEEIDRGIDNSLLGTSWNNSHACKTFQGEQIPIRRDASCKEDTNSRYYNYHPETTRNSLKMKHNRRQNRFACYSVPKPLNQQFVITKNAKDGTKTHSAFLKTHVQQNLVCSEFGAKQKGHVPTITPAFQISIQQSTSSPIFENSKSPNCIMSHKRNNKNPGSDKITYSRFPSSRRHFNQYKTKLLYKRHNLNRTCFCKLPISKHFSNNCKKALKRLVVAERHGLGQMQLPNGIIPLSDLVQQSKRQEPSSIVHGMLATSDIYTDNTYTISEGDNNMWQRQPIHHGEHKKPNLKETMTRKENLYDLTLKPNHYRISRNRDEEKKGINKTWFRGKFPFNSKTPDGCIAEENSAVVWSCINGLVDESIPTQWQSIETDARMLIPGQAGVSRNTPRDRNNCSPSPPPEPRQSDKYNLGKHEQSASPESTAEIKRHPIYEKTEDASPRQNFVMRKTNSDNLIECKSSDQNDCVRKFERCQTNSTVAHNQVSNNTGNDVKSLHGHKTSPTERSTHMYYLSARDGGEFATPNDTFKVQRVNSNLLRENLGDVSKIEKTHTKTISEKDSTLHSMQTDKSTLSEPTTNKNPTTAYSINNHTDLLHMELLSKKGTSQFKPRQFRGQSVCKKQITKPIHVLRGGKPRRVCNQLVTLGVQTHPSAKADVSTQTSPKQESVVCKIHQKKIHTRSRIPRYLKHRELNPVRERTERVVGQKCDEIFKPQMNGNSVSTQRKTIIDTVQVENKHDDVKTNESYNPPQTHLVSDSTTITREALLNPDNPKKSTTNEIDPLNTGDDYNAAAPAFEPSINSDNRGLSLSSSTSATDVQRRASVAPNSTNSSPGLSQRSLSWMSRPRWEDVNEDEVDRRVERSLRLRQQLQCLRNSKPVHSWQKFLNTIVDTSHPIHADCGGGGCSGGVGREGAGGRGGGSSASVSGSGAGGGVGDSVSSSEKKSILNGNTEQISTKCEKPVTNHTVSKLHGHEYKTDESGVITTCNPGDESSSSNTYTRQSVAEKGENVDAVETEIEEPTRSFHVRPSESTDTSPQSSNNDNAVNLLSRSTALNATRKDATDLIARNGAYRFHLTNETANDVLPRSDFKVDSSTSSTSSSSIHRSIDNPPKDSPPVKIPKTENETQPSKLVGELVQSLPQVPLLSFVEWYIETSHPDQFGGSEASGSPETRHDIKLSTTNNSATVSSDPEGSPAYYQSSFRNKVPQKDGALSERVSPNSNSSSGGKTIKTAASAENVNSPIIDHMLCSSEDDSITTDDTGSVVTSRDCCDDTYNKVSECPCRGISSIRRIYLSRKEATSYPTVNNTRNRITIRQCSSVTTSISEDKQTLDAQQGLGV